MTFDEQIATRTMAQECRGEPLSGQVAVAHVLKNRLLTGRWGRSLASVCLWRAQFSGWYSPNDPNFAYGCGLRDDDPILFHMLEILDGALDAENDPTQGATHYYAISMTTPPEWAATMEFCGQFGSQKFFRPKAPDTQMRAA